MERQLLVGQLVERELLVRQLLVSGELLVGELLERELLVRQLVELELLVERGLARSLLGLSSQADEPEHPLERGLRRAPG